MSEAVDGRTEVLRHQEQVHNGIEDKLAELAGLIDEACQQLAELQAQVADHCASHHPPEPAAKKKHGGLKRLRR